MLLMTDEGGTKDPGEQHLSEEPLDTGPTMDSDFLPIIATFEGEHFQISMAAMAGPPSPKTLRVMGLIQEFSTTVLIDSGSSHNIMQPHVAEYWDY